MLQSLDFPTDESPSPAPAAKPFRLNTVVTKGHIRVVSESGLQVVSPQVGDATSPDLAINAVDLGEPENTETNGAENAFVSTVEPSAPWNEGFTERADEMTPIDSVILPPPGLSMKMIKLIAAAAVLGIAAIALTFLQFSRSDSEIQGGGMAGASGYSPVIAAADAGTLSTSPVAQLATASDANNADIVAQITAGTLAALRNGTSKSPAAALPETAAPTSLNIGEVSGLYALVLTALEQGQSRQYIDQMVNDAHRSQKVAVPALLLTSSGEVNTDALLTLFGGQ
ncbi:MAG: hypothetical protein BM560_12930 [Roseobacter sp. MedPE-SWde]|nr:MAG: hypothetical protein BM560_12930 [Roseobacter sp. MedPE-SWde]